MYQPRIVIVGAGIIGLATAYALLKQGMRHVTVLEQATVDHSRSTSRGPSRLLRFEYGEDVFYSEMVRLSLSRWQELERAAQRVLYTPTGLLILGSESDKFTLSSHHAMRELGFPSERISRHACMQRFPQFNVQGCDLFTYNTMAGILHASTCLHTLKDLILDLGGTLCEGCYVTRVICEDHHRPVRLALDSGDTCNADRVVLATGPWIHHILGELQLPVRITRQYLLYFAHLPLTSFKLPSFPSFMAPSFLSGDLYGFPIYNDHGPNWFKAASHSFGVPVDPTATPVSEEHVIAQVTEELCELIPALRHAELACVEACMYDVSLDENFILDCLPDEPRVIFASGLSGHSFKFGPLLGELLSSMVCEKEPAVSLKRFQMARFAGRWREREISVA